MPPESETDTECIVKLLKYLYEKDRKVFVVFAMIYKIDQGRERLVSFTDHVFLSTTIPMMATNLRDTVVLHLKAQERNHLIQNKNEENIMLSSDHRRGFQLIARVVHSVVLW